MVSQGMLVYGILVWLVHAAHVTWALFSGMLYANKHALLAWSMSPMQSAHLTSATRCRAARRTECLAPSPPWEPSTCCSD